MTETKNKVDSLKINENGDYESKTDQTDDKSKKQNQTPGHIKKYCCQKSLAQNTLNDDHGIVLAPEMKCVVVKGSRKICCNIVSKGNMSMYVYPPLSTYITRNDTDRVRTSRRQGGRKLNGPTKNC